MIDGRTDRQTHCDIHTGPERNEFQRDQSLVMIHGDHAVEDPARSFPE